MNEKEKAIAGINAIIDRENPPELNLYIVMLEHLAKEGLIDVFDVYDAITELRREMGLEEIAYEDKEPVQAKDNKGDQEKGP